MNISGKEGHSVLKERKGTTNFYSEICSVLVIFKIAAVIWSCMEKNEPHTYYNDHIRA